MDRKANGIPGTSGQKIVPWYMAVVPQQSGKKAIKILRGLK
jgi:hypothetical protein